MDISWILLALFLVALIWGVVKSLGRSVIKNAMRLGSVIVAFVITLVLQICGVFQGIVLTTVDALSGILNLEELLGGFAGAADIAIALASTVVSMILFSITFFVLLVILRIIVHFVANAIDRAIENKAQSADAAEVAEEQPEVPEQTEPVAAIEAEAEPVVEAQPEAEATTYVEAEVSTEEKVETVEAVEATEAEEPEAAPTEETIEPAAAIEVEKKPGAKEKKKTEKKKIKGFYPECAWKKAVSIATGAISALLILAMVLMPVFYVMSIAVAATEVAKESDAKDSQIYQLLDIADEYVVDSYKRSFVYGFYNAIAIDDLMNYAIKAGGKITLDDGTVVYADDVLKGILAHGISAAMQITSAESECNDVAKDIKAIVSDPVVASVLADVLMDVLADLESEEPAEDDLVAGLVNNFTDYYKNADKATIERDLKAVGGAVGLLAQERILAMLISGNVDTDALLTDKDTLGNIVEAISGLSAFGPTVEGAFELGIDMLGDALHIPENDAQVYGEFMDELIAAMVKSSDSKYTSDDYVTIQNFVKNVGDSNEKLSKYKNTSEYNKFMSYYNQWAKIQSVFAHASEDRSYGYFTMNISGNTYVYDNNYGKIVKCVDAAAEEYKNKISPVADIINELTRFAPAASCTRDDVYAILQPYAASSYADEVGREIASRILAKENFTSNAVTLEKLQAATDFSAWSDDAIKAQDSRLCVDIIIDLLGIMETLGNIEGVGGLEGARDLVGYFVVLGTTLDVMGETSCMKALPELLIEGLIKSDMISDFIAPSIAFQSIEIVKKNDTKTYVDVMRTITTIIEMGLNSFGGMMK